MKYTEILTYIQTNIRELMKAWYTGAGGH